MLSILYVGWDIVSVETLTAGLNEAGHKLVSTYKNDHALFHVGGDTIDFIILDFDNDCDLDILGILRVARAERPMAPIIVLTSFSLTKETLRHTARDLGDLRIVRKPFSEQLIMKTIVEMVNASEVIGDKYRVCAKQHRRGRDFADRRRAARREVNLPLEFSLSRGTEDLYPDVAGIHFGKVKDVGDGGFMFHAMTRLASDMELETSIRMQERLLRTKVSVIRSLPLGNREDHYAVAVKFLN